MRNPGTRFLKGARIGCIAILSVMAGAASGQSQEMAPDSGVDSSHRVQSPMQGVTPAASRQSSSPTTAESLAPRSSLGDREEKSNGQRDRSASDENGWTSFDNDALVPDRGVDGEDDHMDSIRP